ncbi:hypothetical protein AAGV28_06735 [Flavobacterium sp. FZUC8N2.13]|uniref:YXWGXW repeat-containing protein n=1 Tax=Flavobacterium zubiriense TaxID=3138075 RepID=A0ABV4TAE0_9FLAO
MRSLKLIVTGIILFAASTSQAQVSVNVNIGRPVVVRPAWVPRQHVNVDFYYLPEIQTYYDVNSSLYVYLDNGNWCRTRYLPSRYRSYDLNRAHRVELRGYHGSRPYSYYNNHKVKYYNNNRDSNRRYVEDRRYSKNNRYADNYRKNDRRDDDRRYDHRDDHRGNNNGYKNR